MTDWGKTSVGLSANTAACLCYLLGWLSGIVFLLLEKENTFVRFHGYFTAGAFAAVYWHSYFHCYWPGYAVCLAADDVQGLSRRALQPAVLWGTGGTAIAVSNSGSLYLSTLL